MILLKSGRRTSEEMADLLGCCEVVINNRLKRYEAEELEGLKTKPDRGRKPILDAENDLQRVKKAVTANRQRISLAKAELEAESGKSFSNKTIERYIKHGARHKRIRKRPAKESREEV